MTKGDPLCDACPFGGKTDEKGPVLWVHREMVRWAIFCPATIIAANVGITLSILGLTGNL